ncbi:unnamed protein product [Arabidopsis halleri]
MPPDVLVKKVWDDVQDWSVVHSKVRTGSVNFSSQVPIWLPPLQNELKCNIGFSWSRRLSLSGASWVVRDSLGNVLLHSRRSYSRVTSVFDAKIKSWEWALESMASLQLENVLFGASTMDIIKALHNPNQWPAIVSHISPLIVLSGNKPHWFIIFEPTKSNSGAMMIAASVTTDLRLSSYVSRWSPIWLYGFFEHEKRLVNEVLHGSRDDPVLFVPHEAYASVVASNRLSLIGRPLNLNEQTLRGVIQTLPRIWGLVSRVHGRILDDRSVQFRFRYESDLLAVLRRTPCLFNDWFVALQRWQDFPGPDFLTFIDLWVQVRGIPLPYLSELTVSFIAGTLGPVVELDFNEVTSTHVAFIRVKVRIVFTDRLRFFRRVRFESRETAMIGFEYERLRRICTNCCRINHQTENCPFLAAPMVQHDE